jgi:hypothetical protein
MASRSKQSFAKRQKEMARKEKQERKAQRRLERKQARADGVDWQEPEEQAVEGTPPETPPASG